MPEMWQQCNLRRAPGTAETPRLRQFRKGPEEAIHLRNPPLVSKVSLPEPAHQARVPASFYNELNAWWISFE
jgi:hypothetical protein